MAFECAVMTQPEIDGYLHDVHNAVLATIKRDGSPQISSVWYCYDQGQIYINMDRASAKYHNISRDARVSVCIDGGPDDSRTVTIYGKAKFIDPSDPRIYSITLQIFARYSDSMIEAEALVKEISDDESVRASCLIAIKPEKIIALNYN